MIERIKKIFNFCAKNHVTSPFEKFDNMFSSSLGEDIIRIEIGDDLIKFGDRMCEILDEVRHEICEENGFIMPLVRIIDNQGLQENKYRIIIRGNTVYVDYVVPNKDWVEEVFPHDLKKVINENLSAVFTNELTEKYIETVQKTNSWLVCEVFNCISTSEIRIILLDILKEGKSIKDINYIFEKINEQIFIENKFHYREPHKLAKEILKSL